MNVRIFGIRRMECMHAQTRPGFIHLSRKLSASGVRAYVHYKDPQPNGSEDGRASHAASHGIADRAHHQLRYSAPQLGELIQGVKEDDLAVPATVPQIIRPGHGDDAYCQL